MLPSKSSIMPRLDPPLMKETLSTFRTVQEILNKHQTQITKPIDNKILNFLLELDAVKYFNHYDALKGFDKNKKYEVSVFLKTTKKIRLTLVIIRIELKKILGYSEINTINKMVILLYELQELILFKIKPKKDLFNDIIKIDKVKLENILEEYRDDNSWEMPKGIIISLAKAFQNLGKLEKYTGSPTSREFLAILFYSYFEYEKFKISKYHFLEFDKIRSELKNSKNQKKFELLFNTLDDEN